MVLPLPMIKLGGLILRTMTKPLAKMVKTRSKIHPQLNSFCHYLGQEQHRLLIKFHMGYRGVSNYVVKDLPPDQAVEKGADLIGEVMIFSVAVAVASFEYQRSSTKSKENEKIQAEIKKQHDESIERRFEQLEDKVLWLEKKLAKLGQIVEKDITQRLEQEEGQEEADRNNHSSSKVSISRKRQQMLNGTSGGWYISYDSILKLFR